MFLLQNKDKRDFVNGIIFHQIQVPILNDLLCLIDTHHFECMCQIAPGYLLNIEDIIAVKNGLKVFLLQELVLKLVQLLVVGVTLGEVLLLHGFQHFEDGAFGVSWLLCKQVGH